jgi:hypothetical protein
VACFFLSDFLVDFLSVRNTPKLATLFREDSVRIQGVQMSLLDSLREWVRLHMYKPILRKVVSSGGSKAKNVDGMKFYSFNSFFLT